LRAFLSERANTLVELWARRVADELEPSGLTITELTDAMPGFIQQLVAALDVAAGSVPPERVPATASEHGQQRLRVGFDVREVVREYGILGEVILGEVERAGGALTPIETRVLVAQLDWGTREAIGAYVARRDEEVQHEQSRHVAFIAHELRNPLGAASVAMKLLRETGDIDESRMHDIIERSLARLTNLVDEVLVAQSLGAGIEPHRSRLTLSELLAETELDAQAGAQQKGVTVEIAGSLALELQGDRRLLVSALTNLVRNAVKFTPSGGRVVVRASVEGDWLRIEVEDECGGLPGEIDTDELFRPFVQRDTDRRGLGLGLAIARQAIEAHGGRVIVESRPGHGCLFGFLVPRS
jgi:signal transduction histidine kinase